MSKAKIVTVVGARPQFIKVAAVSQPLRESGIEEILVHTGQHYDSNMSAVFFQELGINQPDHYLGIGGGNHGAQTGKMLEAIESVLLAERPAMVLVYGDTNSTLAGALAAVKLHIPVAHVEAGLRSFNRRMPEEINRILTDHACDYLFAPTRTATANLAKEGIPVGRCHEVGDVMYDIALAMGERAERDSRILETLHLKPGGYVLATVHRAENTDDPARLRSILQGLLECSQSLPVVLPIHPRTQNVLTQLGEALPSGPNLRLIPPVGYLDMVMLEKHSALIATDSGGVQKEAYFHKVRCVTLRDQTEWVELVELGWNRLADLNVPGSVAASIQASLASPLGQNGSPYGEGQAGPGIARTLAGILGATSR